MAVKRKTKKKTRNVLHYNGNPRIKKAGALSRYTPEKRSEYEKCANDVLYFIENYCIINTLDRGKILFKPYGFQRKMLKAFDENRFVVNVLPRQMGKTTVVAGYILHYAMFNEDKEIGILANKESSAKEILDRIKLMMMNLPFWLQTGVSEYNKASVTFENTSKLLAFATGSDAVRGRSFSLLYLDEFAFVNGADEFYNSTYPVVSSGKTSKIIITSTPNGLNLFYKIFNEARLKKNSYFPLKIHWSEHPDRDDAWAEQQKDNLGDKGFAQEYECEFMGSSNTLITGNVLSRLTWDNPINETDTIKIFDKPRKNHTYVATVDVSEGVGLDNSVINITDVTNIPYEQVAVFCNNTTSTIVFPEIIHRLVTQYNEALVLVETNSIGSEVAKSLYYEYEYENMLMTTKRKGNVEISNGFSSNIEYGLRMTAKSKSIGCSMIKNLIESDTYKVNDFKCVEELQTFSRKGKSYEAEPHKKDDRVMTLVHFGWLSSQQYFKDLMDRNINRVILNKNVTNEIDEFSDLDSVGFFGDFDNMMNEDVIYNEYETIS